MHIDKINNLYFKAGSLKLNNVQRKYFSSYDSIKKIAEDRGINVSITRNSTSKSLKYDDLYTIISSKNIDNQPVKGTAYAVINNNDVSQEEFSVRIFNSVIMSIENLNKRLFHK